MRQRTLGATATFQGVGLHTGCPVEMSLRPAPCGTGLVFRRTDLGGFAVEASSANIANVSYATTLMKHGVLISTVEHVLSALYAMGVDNAFADVDNLEVPILDGSAKCYSDAIARAGLEGQEAERDCLKIAAPLRHASGDKWVEAEPAPGLEIEYTVDFPHPLIGVMTGVWKGGAGEYASWVAHCRTFGFVREVEALRENGLIKGGSLENAVVLTDGGVANPEGLRFPDEFVGHKIVDFLGDFSLLGLPVRGRFRVYKGGHALHAGMVKKILSSEFNYSVEPA